ASSTAGSPTNLWQPPSAGSYAPQTLTLNLRRSVVQFYSAPLVHFHAALDTRILAIVRNVIVAYL
ncbi:MAG: hypothetical protein QF828_04285, partial [Pseudomonadales bacterium]|nr:hypothetical protein [Pseudomonadales bacterium]